MSKLVIGCGYLGRRVAMQWLGQGETVHAISRCNRRAGELAAEGMLPIVADVSRPATLDKLPAVRTVLFAVGYDRKSGLSMEEVYVDGLLHVLDRLPDSVQRFIYVSSTGVYGQEDGSWVDEDSVSVPTRPGGMTCLAAEQKLAAHEVGDLRVVLRLAGIYGPGRIPRLESMITEGVVRAPAQGYLNLIYIDDAVQAVLAAERYAVPPRTYTVSDGHPVYRSEFYRVLARFCSVPTPSFQPPLLGSGKAERGKSDKRVSNSRMLQELRVQLGYPSFRKGLTAALRGVQAR
ncbi:MAG: NAD(P)-dependent oxidoreductase [Planctomycetaceae bacterium]|nr:NAD(P)-dependent oxidoreductase [Planctomycetaceae bacterium]MBP60358.1 NAD(P)-dependent oxidoreductase [Planctomycetaceae bacterium]